MRLLRIYLRCFVSFPEMVWERDYALHAMLVVEGLVYKQEPEMRK